MSSTELFREALQMTSRERANLAHELLRSLDAETKEPGYDAAWTDELNRRLDQVESGTCELVDADQAMKEARKSLANRKQK
jgi:putative addiction module component (TIGR02574 family)